MRVRGKNDKYGDRDRSTLFPGDAAEDKAIIDIIKQHWDSSEKMVTGLPDGGRILSRIHTRIGYSVSYRRYALVRGLGIAACVALVLISGLCLKMHERSATVAEQTVVYSISSGHQNFERITLPDGTSVKLGAGSRLTYPERFAGPGREVSLDGQAFFDIARDEKAPFVVRTNGMDVTALGTAFEIFAFEGGEKEVVMLDGKVKVDLPAGCDTGETTRLFLVADQSLPYRKRGATRSTMSMPVNIWSGRITTGSVSPTNPWR